MIVRLEATIIFFAGGMQLSADKDGLKASLRSSVEVQGDAVINNRKNKLIPAYELEVKGGWTGMDLSWLHYRSG